MMLEERQFIMLKKSLVFIFSVFLLNGISQEFTTVNLFGPNSFISGYDTSYSYIKLSTTNGQPPLHLVIKQTNLFPKDWSYPPPWPPYEPWPPWPYPIFDVGAIGVYLVVDINFCEDKYHDNGKLSKDVACLNGKLHGKTYHYDETGHKTHEETYHEGKLIKSKYYDDYGRMTSTTHYDFAGRMHGQHIVMSYEDETKSVNNYKHGVQHGEFLVYYQKTLQHRKIFKDGMQVLEQEFSPSGNLIVESIWYNNIRIEYKHYGENGQLAMHQKKDSSDRFIFYKQWDKDGILVKENLYINGKPHGKWLTYHDVARQQKNFENYDLGLKIKNETYVGELCVAYTLFEKEKPVIQVAFFDNADTSMIVNYDEDGSYRQRTWSEKDHRELYSDISFSQDKKAGLFLSHSGFYHDGDTLIKYVIEDENWNMICTHYVLYNNDTVRIDYVRNYSSINQRKEIFWSNYYKLNYDNQYVKNGVWATYQSNNLASWYTYDFGVLHGTFSEYASQGDSVYLVQSGKYSNGLKIGNWITNLDSVQVVENYFNGELSGPKYVYNQDSILLESSYYLNGKLEGKYIQYTGRPYQQIKLVGMYEDGLKTGAWQWYDEFDRIILFGNFKNGEPVGKWIEYAYDERGNQTTKRLNKSEYSKLHTENEILL